MEYRRFNKKDLLFISIAILLLTLSLVFTLKYHTIAFPGQSIDFAISKTQAFQKAENFLKSIDLRFNNFQYSVATFDYPEQTKIFIEKELGIERSHTFFSEDFNIWQWSLRYFTPLEEEEIKISYSTDGKLRYFNHVIPEAAALSSLSQEAALQKAEDFLVKYREADLTQWELKDKSSESKKNRLDYSFTYQKKNVEIYGAHFEIHIKIQGDDVGFFHEHLKLPEFWVRNYAKLRSKNETTGLIAYVFLILLALSSVAYFIYASIRRTIHLKTGIIFGCATLLIFLISQFNNLPLNFFYFDTNQSISNFYTDLITSFFIGALIYGTAVFFLAASGETLYRTLLPKKNKLLHSFSLPGMKTKEFFDATLVGLVTAFLFIAFQILFYMVAEKFGAWSPAQVSYSELVNTKFPWLFILFAGFIPAVTEEFCFRLYGISLLHKYTKSKFFAVLVTAIVWGFAHSNYLNQPFWIRGLEVSIFGLAAGYIFLQFGIVATLVWHFTVDSVLTVILFMGTGNLAVIIPSMLTAGIALLLLGYNLFHYIKNHGFTVNNKILNDFEAEKESADVPPVQIVTHKSSVLPSFTKKQILWTTAGIFFFISLFFIPVKQPGDYVKFSASQQEIIETGKQFLHEQGIDPERFRYALSIKQDCSDACLKYFADHTSVDTMNFIFANYLPNLVSYKIRFFNELEKEEFLVFVHPMDNIVTAFDHKLEEEAMSYNLSKELAQIRVEQFLTQQGYKLENFHLIESFAEVLPHRTDHSFTWESIDNFPANIQDAHLRLSLKVKGDEIGYYKAWYKVPSAWTREQSKQTPLDSVRKVLQIITLPLLLLFILLKYRHYFNFYHIHWKAAIYLAVAFFLLFYFAQLTAIPDDLTDYNTSWSMMNFVIALIFSKFISSLFLTLIFLMVTLICFANYGDKNILKDLHQDQEKGFDIALSALFTTTGFIALLNLQKLITGLNPELTASPAISIPYFLTNNLFTLTIFIKILFASLIFAILFYTFFPIIFKDKLIFLSALIAALLILPAKINTMPEFLYSYFSLIIVILLLYVSYKFFLRHNLLAYLVSGLIFFILYQSNRLISTGFNRAVVTGYFLIGCLIMIIIWLLIKDKTNWYGRITN